MAPVKERAEVVTGATGRQRGETPSGLTTTLYELIAAIQAVVSPEDDALVVATVMHLLRSGRLTWRGSARTRLDQAQHDGNTSPAARLPTARSGVVSWGGDVRGEGSGHSALALEGRQRLRGGKNGVDVRECLGHETSRRPTSDRTAAQSRSSPAGTGDPVTATREDRR